MASRASDAAGSKSNLHTCTIERVIASIKEDGGLVDSFKQQGVPLPPRRKRAEPGLVLLIYTDLEADDIVATTCLLQNVGPTPPVVVLTCDMNDKDCGDIFVKKLTMATAAMGAEFEEELLVVGGEGLPPPPKRFSLQRCPMEVAAERALDRATAGKGLPLLIVTLAPGRGNIAKLGAALKKDARWEAVANRTRISLYSGSFNIRGTTQGDADALAAMVQSAGCVLEDNAHFIWTRNDVLPELRDMPSLMPDMATMLARQNPYLLAAWQIFGVEFYAHLIGPTHKKLWAKGETLTDEEKAVFDEASALYRAGDVEGYCRRILQHESMFKKVTHFKRGTIRCFATGTLDGPLCDCLVFLTRWVEKHAPELITFEKEGAWDVDFEKGFTGIKEEGGLCRALQPMLVDQPPREAARTLADAVLDTLSAAVACGDGRTASAPPKARKCLAKICDLVCRRQPAPSRGR
uniref:Inosine/uridine-preferring nucleoside hydrolase domain-containing protein n=1 Tax=Alexandrium monilatum TaxID=311494 RepID=A0A6T0Z0U0_9DINO|mmetsp:Transcript_81295/g.242242  ORF Transcript_81295/g.242242 Transcript_81295/m.242242 type:complete len:463 (+) Transcript_81295:99-1487(+)